MTPRGRARRAKDGARCDARERVDVDARFRVTTRANERVDVDDVPFARVVGTAGRLNPRVVYSTCETPMYGIIRHG